MEINTETFLAKVAARIRQEHAEGMHKACVVLPNRRAEIFLKRHLCETLQSPALGPSIFSVEDFVFELVGLSRADQLLLLYDLYECYLQVAGQDARTFEEYLKWANTLLQDFEDADMYMVDTQSMFSYLSEAKALELWNPGKSTLTPGQQKYLRFYRSLAALHQRFTGHLVQQRMAYKGLAFRQLAENMNEKIPAFHWEHIYFAGFNALTPSEKKIIDSLAARVKVTNLYDADEYYLNNTNQEAGKFLREISRQTNSGKIEWVGNTLSQGSKKIQLTGVPHNIGQALVAGSLLAGIDPAELDHTALILNDESLLIPLLNAVPDNVAHFNVTMGYPLSLTPVYGLMNELFKLHLFSYSKDRQQAGDENTPQVRYYFRNVAAILRHPYVANLLKMSWNTGDDPLTGLLGQGKVYFTKDEILSPFSGHKTINSFLESVFADWRQGNAAVERLMRIISTLASSMADAEVMDQHKIDLEYLYQFSLILNRLQLLTGRAGEALSLQALHQLIKSLASTITLPFAGEPLRGVQIMGMLETRLLDFKNIIMLSVNEGVLPAAKHANSFIPFDIRKEFKLPVYADRDAVFAYHFYRLLQRSNNIHLIYNTTSDNTGGGEKSRFVLQIEHELIKANPEINFSEHFYSPALRIDQSSKAIVVNKTPDIAARLAEIASYGLSPTALSNYVSCPLKFYYTNILKISEEAATEDTMDAATFGTAIHDALAELYEPYTGRVLTHQMLDEIAGKSSNVLHNSFLRAFFNNDLSYGKNLLMVKVAESFLRRFIRLEKEHLNDLKQQDRQLIINALEYEFSRKKPIELFVSFQGNDNFPVRLRGTADRIDSTDDLVRVIDFKTGFVRKGDIKIAAWDQLIELQEKGKALQLLVYAYLYAREFDAPLPESGIISFRHLNDGFMKVDFPKSNGHVLQDIDTVLGLLLQNIFDINRPFDQTTDEKACQKCQYSGICGR